MTVYRASPEHTRPRKAQNLHTPSYSSAGNGEVAGFTDFSWEVNGPQDQWFLILPGSGMDQRTEYGLRQDLSRCGATL